MLANKRGQTVALGGLLLQLVLAALAVALWWFTQLGAGWPALWLVIAPAPIWLVTLILFYCRYLQRREAQELEDLAARGGDRASIFTEGPDGQPMRPADRRLKWMERYLVAAFTLLLAGYHVVLGILLLRSVGAALGGGITPQASAWMFVAIGLAFISLLFSRYATGMAKIQAWRLLRAPGSYLFTNSVVFFLLAAVLAAEHYKSHTFGNVVAYVLPVFMLIVGAELLLNFILDLYRPRIPGAESRFSYDSRMLNLIASPESIGHSIAEALNYQFGFEVSSSWFYQLLQRAFAPLLLAGVMIVWLMTSVVVVEEGQAYVVLHWGKEYPSGHPQRLLTPRSRPYLIWPWPIDTARKFDTGKVHEIILGVGGKRKEKFAKGGKRVYLWTDEHGPQEELDTLVAIAPRPEQRRPQRETRILHIPSVNLIKLIVAVYYRIDDPYKFGYTVTDPHKLLKAAAYREMIRYAASATLDERAPGPPGSLREEGIMSGGRAKAARDLQQLISQAVSGDKLDLGVEIVGVEILGCHPGKDAADAFEKVIAAERQQDKLRYEAQGEANKVLAAVAGDPDQALKLSQAIGFRQELKALLDLRDRGKDLAAGVGEVIVRAQNEADRLKEETEMERRMGKLSANTKTIAQVLLERQTAFLSILKNTDPAGADLDAQVAAAQKEEGRQFEGVQGQAAVAVARARADRWRREFRERARAETFDVQLLSLNAAPQLYSLDKYLDALGEGIKNRKKYILAADRDKLEVRLNLQEQQESLGELPLGGGN